MQFQNKTVLITGASSGIGRACALRFAQDGASLILTARRHESLESVTTECGGASIIPVDLTDETELDRFCSQVIAEFNTIDVIVHNAGVGLYESSLTSVPANIQQMMALNFHAPVEITRRLLPLLPPGGSVVTVSSLAGKVVLPNLVLYAASKHALNAYTNGLRMEVSKRGIHVLNLCPCYVDTPFSRNLLQGKMPDNMPGKRRFTVSPEQCAESILKGILKRKRTIVIPRIGWMIVILERLFPALVHGRMAKFRNHEVTGDSAE